MSITQALGGLTGEFEGLLRERTFRTVALMEADLWKIKERGPASQMRLVTDQTNIPVGISGLSCTTTEESVEGYPRRRVGFRFWQTGEFEFEGRV
jgi:hypothetical protein